ncbi:MAG: hypothetical protein VYD53_18210, partial [Pseudomonadota bacterium]|nr:hypothetical protein [Pseudomonadota bacterium]
MKKKLYPFVVLVLIGSLLIFTFSYDERSYFTLELHGMNDLEITNIIVEGTDFTTGFYMTAQTKEKLGGLKIKVDSPVYEGTATIIINIENSSPLFLSNMLRIRHFTITNSGLSITTILIHTITGIMACPI